MDWVLNSPFWSPKELTGAPAPDLWHKNVTQQLVAPSMAQGPGVRWIVGNLWVSRYARSVFWNMMKWSYQVCQVCQVKYTSRMTHCPLYRQWKNRFWDHWLRTQALDSCEWSTWTFGLSTNDWHNKKHLNWWSFWVGFPMMFGGLRLLIRRNAGDC